MPLAIDSKRWLEGFQDAYAGRAAAEVASGDHSYALGLVEGEALRVRHRDEFERALSIVSQVGQIPKRSA